MTVGKTDEIKQELARKAENTKAGTKINLKFITQSVIISKKYCRQKTPRMEYPRSLFAYKGIRRKRGYGVIECNRHR